MNVKKETFILLKRVSSAKGTVSNKYLKLGKLDWFKEQKAVPVAESERRPSRGGGWRGRQGPWSQQHFNFMLSETGSVIWEWGDLEKGRTCFYVSKFLILVAVRNIGGGGEQKWKPETQVRKLLT